MSVAVYSTSGCAATVAGLRMEKVRNGWTHPGPLATVAYLLEGIALLRAWAGDFDKDFVDRRLAEIRRLLATDALTDHAGTMVERGDTLTGYRQWAATYDDEPRNGLFDEDEPIMHEIIRRPPTRRRT